MRARSSVKWTALTGVTPGRIGSSVNGAVTRTPNVCTALRPSGSAALTSITARPGAAALSVTRAPAGTRPVKSFSERSSTLRLVRLQAAQLDRNRTGKLVVIEVQPPEKVQVPNAAGTSSADRFPRLPGTRTAQPVLIEP